MGTFVELKSGKKSGFLGMGETKNRGVTISVWGETLYISLTDKDKNHMVELPGGPPFLIRISDRPLDNHHYEPGTASPPLLEAEVGEALVRKNRAMVKSLRQIVGEKAPLPGLDKGPYNPDGFSTPPLQAGVSKRIPIGASPSDQIGKEIPHIPVTPAEKNSRVKKVLEQCLKKIESRDDREYNLRETIHHKIEELRLPLPRRNLDGSYPGRTAT